jgi:hypothetical protein
MPGKKVKDVKLSMMAHRRSGGAAPYVLWG